VFDELPFLKPQDYDVLLMTSTCITHAKMFSDEELIARLQNIEPEVELEDKVDTGMAYFFHIGTLGKYRSTMEDAYVLYFSELGYNESGEICAIHKEEIE